MDAEGDAGGEGLPLRQAVLPLPGGLPGVGGHTEEVLDVLPAPEGDGFVHRDDSLVGKALIGGPPLLVGVGAVVEDLLHLPEVLRPRDHVKEVPAGLQDPAVLRQGQGGEAVEESVHRGVRQRQMVGGGHGELNVLLPLGSGAENELGDVDARHPGLLPRRPEGLIDSGGVVALPAAGVQQGRKFPAAGDNLTTKGIQKGAIIPAG